jgi:uncharacterized protein YjbI with pentapeptide repeats
MPRKLPLLPRSPQPHPDLTPDCERCCGLCCVAPAFARSPDFAIDKALGEACPNLAEDFRCAIHARLRAEGFRGCVAYDCFGAGQKVTQETFQGRDWKGSPAIATEMFAVFAVMRDLHAMLSYLHQALELPAAGALFGDVRRTIAELEACTHQGPQDLLRADVVGRKAAVNELLLRVSELVRSSAL